MAGTVFRMRDTLTKAFRSAWERLGCQGGVHERSVSLFRAFTAWRRCSIPSILTPILTPMQIQTPQTPRPVPRQTTEMKTAYKLHHRNLLPSPRLPCQSRWQRDNNTGRLLRPRSPRNRRRWRQDRESCAGDAACWRRR